MIVLITIACILGALVAARLFLPILDWWRSRYRNDKSEFISDLYKIQMKWSKRGFMDYSSGVGMVIDAFNLKPEKEKAKTEYGRQMQKDLDILSKEEE